MEWLLRKEEKNNEAVFAFELDVFKKQNTLAVPRDAKFVITWRRYFRIAGNANPTVRVSGTVTNVEVSRKSENEIVICGRTPCTSSEAFIYCRCGNMYNMAVLLIGGPTSIPQNTPLHPVQVFRLPNKKTRTKT